ncbi:hypothetical protein [Methylomonas sp. 11b]|uniref:hypothetical protein n=1 Tax=Methylomonas sp. 11b TaxID=1168169 RepID=UPI00047A0A1A|nr:hypothetical protein [Methylomonas sp. 11b]
MTVADEPRKAGPYNCDGVVTVFPFSFKVFAAADLLVVHTDANDVETDLALAANYTVSLNSDQDNNPGGTITTIGAYPLGDRITMTSDIAYSQNLQLTGAGGFYPTSISDALDRVVMQVQQIVELLSRTARAPLSGIGSLTPSEWVFGINASGVATLVKLADITQSAISAFMSNILVSSDKHQARALLGVKTKNHLVNGSMAIDTIYAGDTYPDVSGYTLDQWFSTRVGAVAGCNIARVSYSLGIDNYAMKISRTAGNNSNAMLMNYQPLELVNCAIFQGETVTFSFLAGTGADTSALTGNVAQIYYQTTATEKSPTDTWTLLDSQNFSVTNNNPGNYYDFQFSIPANSTQLMVAVGFVVSGIAGADDSRYLTNAQLEIGTNRSDFEWIPYDEKLKQCRRYLQKSYFQDIKVGQSTPIYSGQLTQIALNTNSFYTSFPGFKLSEEMRAVPSFGFYNADGVNHGSYYNYSINAVDNGVALSFASTKEFGIGSSSNTMTVDQLYATHWVASARI